MKIGVSYKQQKIEGNYDMIVIGSGIGGLALGAIMAKEGKKVLVLEKHYTVGGFTHTFKRRNYEWDVGVHYIGEVGGDSALKRVFDYVSDGNLKWADMGEVYDRIVFGNEQFDFVKGTTNFKDNLKKQFPDPDDHRAIDEYVELVYKAAKSARGYYAEKALPGVVRWAASPFMTKSYMKYASRTTLDVMSSLTSNKKLIAVLTGQYGDYGLPPSQSSFAMHATVAKHYFRGGYYPVGGSARFAETIVPQIEAGGGAVYTNAGVKEVIVEGNKATGVRMDDGNEIYAPVIVSSAGIMNTYGNLLPQNIRQKIGTDKIKDQLKPSAAHLCLYVGFQQTAEELNIPKCNYWVYSDIDHDKVIAEYMKDSSNPFPVIYLSYPGAKDPDFTNRFPGRCTVEIITLARNEDFAKWEGTPWKKRGTEYEAMKESFSQRMLEELYKQMPQTRGKVDYYELSSPLTTKHFANYGEGEIYGVWHTPSRFSNKLIQPRTPVKNLYMTGQDVVTAGVGGALMASVITGSVLIKKNLMSKIINHFD